MSMSIFADPYAFDRAIRWGALELAHGDNFDPNFACRSGCEPLFADAFRKFIVERKSEVAEFFLFETVIDLSNEDEVEWMRYFWLETALDLLIPQRWIADKWFYKDLYGPPTTVALLDNDTVKGCRSEIRRIIPLVRQGRQKWADSHPDPCKAWDEMESIMWGRIKALQTNAA